MELSDRVRRLCALAVLVAVSVALSAVERPLMASLPLPLPGFKLGFANIAVLFALYRMSKADAAAVLGVRIALTSLLFGSPVSFALSLTGGSMALSAAFLLKGIKKLTPVGVSVAASSAHMVGQICAASLILKSPGLFVSYLPWLLFLSVPAGTLTGAISEMLILRIPKSR